MSVERMLMATQMPEAAAELLHSAWQCMRYAERVADANVRFSLAHRSALRAAAAVVAVRARAASTREGPALSRPQNVWLLLQSVAPELSEWADYYNCATPVRQAAESGSPGITSRMADDAVRDAVQFIWEAAATTSRVSSRMHAMQPHAG
jgi:hypothetical protein